MSDKQARMMRHLHHINDQITAFEVGAARCYFWRGLKGETSSIFAVHRCSAIIGGTVYVNAGILRADSKAHDLVKSLAQFSEMDVEAVAPYRVHEKADELAMAGAA